MSWNLPAVRPVIPWNAKRQTNWQKKEEDIPVEPLSFEYGESIEMLLRASGGVLPLGRVTQQFPGLKRVQLEGIFELSRVGQDGQFEVRLPGCESAGVEIMVHGQAVSKDEPLPPLDEDSIASISAALEQEPRFEMPLGKVRHIVPGVRREQLENDFQVTRVNKKNFTISLKYDGHFPMLPKKECIEQLNQSGGFVLPGRASSNCSGPPVEPLSFEWGKGIEQLLHAFGGVLPLGNVTQHFPGLKRAQLEGHFELRQFGQDGQFEVRLPGCVFTSVNEEPMPSPLDEDSIANIAPKFFPKPQQRCTGQLLQAGGFILPRRASSDPVEPLSFEYREGIEQLLQCAGGVLPLGKVTQQFPGLKRVQLEGIFELSRVGQNGQFEVRLPGCESAGVEIMVQGHAVSKDEPLPPLDEGSIASIRAALEQQPGFAMQMGRIREIVPGVNRQQLENDFEVTRLDKKHFVVSLRQGGALPRFTGFQMGHPGRTFQDHPAAKRQRWI